MDRQKQMSEAPVYRLDWLKWALVWGIVAAVAVLNSMYSESSLFYRVLGGFVMVSAALLMACQTARGSALWDLAKGARAEMRRVVWPGRAERNQATLMVVVVVFIVALILWGLDGIFGWLSAMVLV